MDHQTQTWQKNRNFLFISIIGALLVTIILVFVIGGLLGERRKASSALTGKWLRSDGVYQIEISEVGKDGLLEAAYYNPEPINVGRSGWRYQEGELQIYIELQDENYPGSIYQLTFDKEKEILAGTYYQAVYKQTYNVSFNKVK